jgi:hypothetical protein
MTLDRIIDTEGKMGLRPIDYRPIRKTCVMDLAHLNVRRLMIL